MKICDVWIASGAKGTQCYMGQVRATDKRRAVLSAHKRWMSDRFVIKEASGYLTFEMLSQWKNHLVSMESRFRV